MLKKLTATLIMTITLSIPAFADENKLIIEAGVGIMYDSGIYKGEKNRVEPLPLINARYGIFSFEYDRAKLYINDDLAVVVAMGRNGHELKGMDSRSMAISTGIDYKIKLAEELSTRIKINENFFGSKNGISTELSLEKEIMLTESDLLSLGCGVEYIDDNMSNYYFGVKKSEESLTRKSYKAKGAVIPSLKIDGIKILTPNIYLLLTTEVEFYPKEITDSPIVDSNVTYNAILGVCYKFK